jgi:hypothetical protein
MFACCAEEFLRRRRQSYAKTIAQLVELCAPRLRWFLLQSSQHRSISASHKFCSFTRKIKDRKQERGGFQIYEARDGPGPGRLATAIEFHCNTRRATPGVMFLYNVRLRELTVHRLDVCEPSAQPGRGNTTARAESCTSPRRRSSFWTLALARV